MSKALQSLVGEQRDAVEPGRDIWLGASAGTGKTQVLSSRVMRLLLEDGVEPENILCLTFTKAGATEMGIRINETLARWVRLDDISLSKDLSAIGADTGPDSRRRARQLFARLLDAPGGGMRILTIHSFCQSLLSSFPMEAGIMPGFRPLDEREQKQLARSVLAELIAEAATDGRGWIVDAVAELGRAMGEDTAERFLSRCASVPAAMELVPGDPRGALVFANRIAGVTAEGSIDDWLADACRDEQVDCAGLRELAGLIAAWGKRDAADRAARIHDWLARDVAGRSQALHELARAWAKKEGGLFASKGWMPDHPGYMPLAEALNGWAEELLEQAALARWAARLAGALSVGRAYALAYAEAKRVRGVMDFDDLIARAAKLLADPTMGDWIRFKLDARVDHVLIDEAQDTNRAQWDIVRALTQDFFSGHGAREGRYGEEAGGRTETRRRTLFTVGDYKQAIYSFQGTSPKYYDDARRNFSAAMALFDRQLDELSLTHSFRSTRPILDFVDEAVRQVGPGGFGEDREIPLHLPTRGPEGEVLLLPPVVVRKSDDEDSGGDEEGWTPVARRILAAKLARQVREWIDDPEFRRADGKRLTPGDIMFLVRNRGELAGLLVARLHAEGVPVAGVDRLRLGQPLGVRDVLSAIRFVLQPGDDLNLAALLVSPLIGWTQDDLLARVPRAKGARLWRHLREHHRGAPGMADLEGMLNRADFSTPHRFVEDLLGGALDGRRRLWLRLGGEVLDPLAELVNAAIQFESNGGASLQGFIDWFDRGDVDIKRDAGEAGAEVRVMTVHGSKGLQASLVILADCCVDPLETPDRSLDLHIGDLRLPVLPINKVDRVGRLAEAVELHQARALEEHRRLLYVALTRAKERLVLAGSLPKTGKEAPANSWYPILAATMDGLGVEEIADPLWGRKWVLEGLPPKTRAVEETKAGERAEELPAWLLAPAPPEARPPRPLAPSGAGADDAGDAPPDGTLRRAAKRGTLLHSLFERLPAAEPDRRHEAAAKWLESRAQDFGADERAAMADAVCAVIGDPRWSELFGPHALAEAPIAAVIGETVVTGRVDRLLVAPDRIQIVDFKTGSKVPRSIADIPVAYLRQMAWYVSALEKLFPDRPVTASLLYSHGPQMVDLATADLAPHRPG